MGSQTTTESFVYRVWLNPLHTHTASDIVPALNTYLSLRGDLPYGGWTLSSLAAMGELADGGGRG